MVSNVLRGRAFAVIGDYSGGKGGWGVVGGGGCLRKREALATVATSLQLELKAIVDAN